MLGHAHNLQTPLNKCRCAAPRRPHTVRPLRLFFLELGLRHLTLPNPYRTLSYPTLPYPTLPYPTLPYPTLPNDRFWDHGSVTRNTFLRQRKR